MDPIALITDLIDAIKDLIHEVKVYGEAIKEVSDPSLATNPLSFPAGAVDRAKYLGTKSTALIDAMNALFDIVNSIIP